MIVKQFLVIRADGEVRVMKRPRVGPDEVCFQLNITIPDGWGKIVGPPVTVNLPDPPGIISVQLQD